MNGPTLSEGYAMFPTESPVKVVPANGIYKIVVRAMEELLFIQTDGIIPLQHLLPLPVGDSVTL